MLHQLRDASALGCFCLDIVLGDKSASGERIEHDTHYWGPRHVFAYEQANQLIGGARTCLEVGCGNAYGSALLAATRTVVAIDIDWKALGKDAGGVLFVAASGAQLPFAHGSFDAIVSFQMIEHIDYKGGAAMVAEMRRVLRPGGIAVLTTPNRLTYGKGFDRPNPFHVHEYVSTELLETFCNSFESVSMFGVALKSGTAAAVAEEKLRQIQGADRLGIRRFVPESVKRLLRRLVGTRPLEELEVSTSDFQLVRQNIDTSLDLFVVAQ